MRPRPGLADPRPTRRRLPAPTLPGRRGRRALLVETTQLLHALAPRTRSRQG
ncbi:hypothetical protein NKH77_50465 [Streptomyces sp. M19]